MIAVIDYDAGNTANVLNAFRVLGADVILTNDEKTLYQADRVVLPGVGAFGDAMHNLRSRSLVTPIKELIAKEVPFLGICVGMQLLFEGSEESAGVEGLSLLSGSLLRFPASETLKVPQIGWNRLHKKETSRLLQSVEDGAHVYFVHSYYLPDSETASEIVATVEYGVTAGAVIERGNLFACQFHPEKSADVGLDILKSFIAV